MRIQTAPFIFLCMLGFAAAVPAQEKVTLTGVITDETTLEPLSGASIVLKGTGLGTAADAKGRYIIQNIEAGTYLVQVSLVGYTKVQRTGVVMRAGDTLILDFKLKESSVSSDAVTVIGERPLMDVEQTTSSSTLSPELIALAPLKDVRELAATQIGVVKTPDGLHLRGGRSYETGFYIDGISVRDPLAGTGFGLDLTPEAFADLEIITGGAGAEFGESSAGVVKVKTKEGGDVYHSSLTLRRDNLFFDTPVGWNTSRYAATASGPVPFKKILPSVSGNFYFFAALSANFTDEFYKTPAQQLRPTEFSTLFAPANDNKWDGIFKLTYKLSSTDKFTLLLTRSLVINQNTQTLQITGNDIGLQPGYQFAFALIPDSGNVYTHDTNVEALQWTHVFSRQTVLSLQATRFFTQLRAEVGGLPWRPKVLEADFDPQSVVTNPQYVNPNDTIVYVAASSGLYSKGVAPLWHDHYAEDYGIKADLLYNTEDESQRLLFGLDTKFSEYQWIDLTRPWIGAPYAAGEPSRRLGIAPDIWRVNAAQGAIYVSDNVRLGDFFATAGVRVQYWLPGSFLDDAVADPNSLVPPGFREPYLKNTFNVFGRRVNLRVLPKVSLSFPFAPAQTFFFNYGQSSMLPHPRFLYAGLDARYSDDSTTARIGNPSLRPEITTAYELGLRGQFSENDVVTLTGFYKDVKDLIVSAKLEYTDPRTGRKSERLTQINEDFGRVRGVEFSYRKRIGKWFEGTASVGYQAAIGQSNSSEETAAGVIRNDSIRPKTEFPLAWDRPIDAKLLLLFRVQEGRAPFDSKFFNDWQVLITAQYSSGLRYNDYRESGVDANGRAIYVRSSSLPYSKIGEAWVWIDLSLEKKFRAWNYDARFSVQVKNLLNNYNSAIINPVTGRAYQAGDALPYDQRDPAKPTLQDAGLPPENPARYLPPVQVLIGAGVVF